MTTPDSTSMPDPTTPVSGASDLAPPVLARWIALLLAVAMFGLVPSALVLLVVDRPNMREAMDATGSFLGGVGGWGALILSLVLCVLQAYRERCSQ
ncbi:hypothetical protein ABZ371_00010 [Streptomyces sp. NPDC005899]|uniref:hypothetical protein n=1 Tax=Streptomyces sp. NPDC005899 TaxID=3155716 RepID=UPI0033DA9221